MNYEHYFFEGNYEHYFIIDLHLMGCANPLNYQTQSGDD
jgi:hypothetical protein